MSKISATCKCEALAEEARQFLLDNKYSDLVMKEDSVNGVSERVYLADIMAEFTKTFFSKVDLDSPSTQQYFLIDQKIP